MGNTPLSGWPYPELTDAGNVPASIEALARAAEKNAIMRFASAADRSSKLPSPLEGMLSYRLDTHVYERFDGTSWVALFGLDGLPNKKVVRGAADGNVDITSTSLSNFTGASMSFTKKFSASQLIFTIHHSGYMPTGNTATELYGALSFNGVDYGLVNFFYNTAGEHHSFSQARGGIGVGVAGTYTIQLKYKLTASGAGKRARFDNNDPYTIIVEECQNL